jgi:AbrB family looped-hinge helix DNA binding protein
MIASITSKGQITIPVEARRRLGLRAGMKLDFVINAHDHLELVPLVGSVCQLKGMVPKPERVLSLADMDAAVAKGAGE